MPVDIEGCVQMLFTPVFKESDRLPIQLSDGPPIQLSDNVRRAAHTAVRYMTISFTLLQPTGELPGSHGPVNVDLRPTRF